MTIGDRIRRIRKKRRLTQAELAMMSGLSLSAIQGYEQGRYEPKRKSLERIAEVFKIPVEELYITPAELGTNLAEVGTDCISRQAAIKATWQDTGYTDPFNVMTAIRDRIQQLPPIQSKLLQPWEVLAAQSVLSHPAEPKRGKWIDKGWTGDWQYLTDGRGDCWRNIVCSECGESVRHESNFCPNCGAKMEVDDE